MTLSLILSVTNGLFLAFETRFFSGVTRVFQGWFKGVSRVSQGCLKGVPRVSQGRFKGVF